MVIRKGVSVDEFNQAISSHWGPQKYERYNYTDLLSANIYIWQDNRWNYHAYFKDAHNNNKVTEIYTNIKLGRAIDVLDTSRCAGNASSAITKYLKKYDESIQCDDNDESLHWELYHYYNTKYQYHVLQHVYAYDMNAAFLAMFKKPLPIGNIKDRNRVVQPGEIGFVYVVNRKGETALNTVFEGAEAEIIFDTYTYEAFSAYADKMYAKKYEIIEKYGKESTEYQLWKVERCCAYSTLKHKGNIYIATAIVDYAKREIMKYRDENTLMSTVDSIYSLKPIDLPISDNLGEFKEEYSDVGLYYESDGKYQVFDLQTMDILKDAHKGKAKELYDESGMLLPDKYYFDYKRGKLCPL